MATKYDLESLQLCNTILSAKQSLWCFLRFVSLPRSVIGLVTQHGHVLTIGCLNWDLPLLIPFL